MAAHTLCTTLVLVDHAFCLLRLMLVVRRLGLLELLFRGFLLLFQATFRLPNGTRLARTRAKKQDHYEEADNENGSFFHPITI